MWPSKWVSMQTWWWQVARVVFIYMFYTCVQTITIAVRNTRSMQTTDSMINAFSYRLYIYISPLHAVRHNRSMQTEDHMINAFSSIYYFITIQFAVGHNRSMQTEDRMINAFSSVSYHRCSLIHCTPLNTKIHANSRLHDQCL